MQLTVDFLQKKFNEFNKQFFNNELPPIPLKISRSKTQFGCFSHTRIGYKPISISISKYYDQTQKQYSETLIHEMIHYYLCIKRVGRSNPHGEKFLKIMNEINASQNKYIISVKASSKGLVSQAAKRGKEHTILVFTYNGKKYFSKVTGKLKTKDNVEKIFTDIKIIEYLKTTSQAAERLCSRTSKLSLIEYNETNLKRYGIAA